LALYDLTSSYFEGVTCPLAELGYTRDGKKGTLQVNYGLLTNPLGVPVAVSVFKGSTGDPKTLMPQVQKVRSAFGIKEFVLVGDRGMISQKRLPMKGRKHPRSTKSPLPIRNNRKLSSYSKTSVCRQSNHTHFSSKPRKTQEKCVFLQGELQPSDAAGQSPSMRSCRNTGAAWNGLR
jgi:hypothetical protein